MLTCVALLGTALVAAPHGVPVPDATREIPDGLREEFRLKFLRDLIRTEEDLALIRSMRYLFLDAAQPVTNSPAERESDASLRKLSNRFKEEEAKLVAHKRKLMRSWIP